MLTLGAGYILEDEEFTKPNGFLFAEAPQFVEPITAYQEARSR